jgi:hypothetical protein
LIKRYKSFGQPFKGIATNGRHGTGVIYWKGKVYVAAGSANRGGGPELNDMECMEWK